MYIYNLNLYLAALGLHCSRGLSLVAGGGLWWRGVGRAATFHFNAAAAHCGDSSLLSMGSGYVGLITVVHQPSCSAAFGSSQTRD